jgi:hypothetical protein
LLAQQGHIRIGLNGNKLTAMSNLGKYLKNLKFVVLIDRKTGNPFELFFGFQLPHANINQFCFVGK